MTPDNTGKPVQRVSNQRNLIRLLGVMVRHDCSLNELSERSGIHYETLRPVIKMLHADGTVHISHWRIDSLGRQSIAVYRLGLGTDAAKRKPKTGAERSMTWKNKQEAKADRLESAGPVIKNSTIDALLRTWKATEVVLA